MQDRLRLKICDSHLTCKVANKCLNVRERVEVVEWKKMVPSLPLLSCELSVSVKENRDRKKINKKKKKKKVFLNQPCHIWQDMFEEIESNTCLKFPHSSNKVIKVHLS